MTLENVECVPRKGGEGKLVLPMPIQGKDLYIRYSAV